MSAALLRLATEADAARMLEIYKPIVLNTPISFETEVPDESTFRERITSTMQRYPWLVCTDGTEVFGYAYATVFRTRAAYAWSAETSVYVAEKHRRKGVARALYRTLLAALAEQGFQQIYAGITLPNDGSVALHEELGFTKIGVFKAAGFKYGRWHDVGFWQLSLDEEARQVTTPPHLLMEIVGKPEWQEILQQGTRALAEQDDG